MSDHASTDETHLSAISLFSGAGGMDVGVKAAGFRVLLANDIDPDACDTYGLNHSEPVYRGSVTDLIPLLQHVAGVDLVFGGPPCQGFSVAGKMDPSDPRSALIFAFFDAVDAASPRAFICENVKALATLQRWSEVRSALMTRANEKYHASLIVLKASNYGVPQNRERMFIVGVRKDIIGGVRADFAAKLQASIEAQQAVAPTIGEIIRDLGPAGSQGNSRVCKAKITYAKAPVLRKSPYAGMLFNGAGRPLPADGWAPTLPASMGGNKTPIVDEDEIFEGSESAVAQYHATVWRGGRPKSGTAPIRLRRLTIDECLAIQSFPHNYELSGPQSSMYRQIGNAVPCQLAAVVARAVRQLLSKASSTSVPIIPEEIVTLAAASGKTSRLRRTYR